MRLEEEALWEKFINTTSVSFLFTSPEDIQRSFQAFKNAEFERYEKCNMDMDSYKKYNDERYDRATERICELEEEIKNRKKSVPLTMQMSMADIKRICAYEEIGEYSEGLAVVRDKYGKYGYVNESIEEVIECQYYEAFDFSDGLAVVKKDGKYGYIDNCGEVVLDFVYDGVSDFENGKACVKKDDETFIINEKGEIINLKLHEDGECVKYLYDVEGCSYDKRGEYSEGFAVVVKNGKYSYIDCYEDSDYDFSDFDEAFPFSDGVAVVKKDGKYKYASKNEEEITKYAFSKVSDFIDGIACVERCGKRFIINKDGEILGWNLHWKYEFNPENSDDEVIYHPNFVGDIIFFRENGRIIFLDNKIRYVLFPEEHGFKIVDNIDSESVTLQWYFCNGIPFYKKSGYKFVINVDFEHEDKTNEHDGLGIIRYIRRIFGYKYFKMVFENNELKMMAFESLKNEEKISNFMEAVKEYLVKNGEWDVFLIVCRKNEMIHNESQESKAKTNVYDIKDENRKENKDKEDAVDYKKKTTEYDKIHDEIIKIAKDQKKIFEALDRLIKKTKSLGISFETENIIKEFLEQINISSDNLLGTSYPLESTTHSEDATVGEQYAKKRQYNKNKSIKS